MKIQGFPLPVLFMMHPAAWKYKASCDNKLWKFLVSKSKQNPEIPSKIRNYRPRWTLCLRGFAPNNSDSLTINSFCRNIFKPYKLSFKYSRHYLLSTLSIRDPKYCRNCRSWIIVPTSPAPWLSPLCRTLYSWAFRPSWCRMWRKLCPPAALLRNQHDKLYSA